MSRATLKAIQAAAGAGAGEAVYVDDVFSTYLYEGNATTRSIVNGLDLDGEGGLVWIKSRTAAYSHVLFDTERGATKRLYTNVINEEDTAATSLTAFNSDGFSLGSLTGVNGSGTDFASWTFRKQPGFFDVVTYTGNGTNQTISHNLGSTPGFIVVKRTDDTSHWICYHSGLTSGSYIIQLNTDNAEIDFSSYSNTPWSSINDSSFTVGHTTSTFSANVNTATYVAYLFAHDAQDFGTDSDESIIKCGSFTTNGSGLADVNLGWEPQWILVKPSNPSGFNWYMNDSMRQWPADNGTDYGDNLYANLSNAEGSNDGRFYPTSTGFSVYPSQGIGTGTTCIYVAIRRPHKPASEFAATDLFAIDTRGSTGDGNAPGFRSGFPVDMAIFDTNITSAGNRRIYSRLTKNFLEPPSTGAEVSANFELDYMNGWLANVNTVSTAYSWMFRRAPGFFDVVAYTGTGSTLVLNHNLGVEPEFMIVKGRTINAGWHTYHKDVGNTKAVPLNSYGAASTSSFYWNNTSPTATQVTLGAFTHYNVSNQTGILYLFATVPGISKVGSYTGNGTSLDIDCGFTSGARFVLIKASSNDGNWLLFDSARGIVAGNDSWLRLNSTNEQVGGNDLIDPLASGFTVNFDNVNNFDGPNRSGYTYIFLAIA